MDSPDLAAISIDEALDAGHTLIVPAPRLVRILKQRLALWRAPGQRVLRTPDVLTVEQWLQCCLDDWRLLGQWTCDLPARLDELAERTLWEQALADCEADNVLLDRDAAAALAMDTWHRVMDWHIPLDGSGPEEAEWQRFQVWLACFRRRCDSHGVADGSVWLEHVMRALRREAPAALARTDLVLVGFVEFTHQQRELLKVLQALGVRLHEAALPQQAACRQRVVCEARDQEWLAAAGWARQYLQAHPDHQVAVLVHEFGQYRERIAQAFEAVFHPQALLQPGDDIARSYNLSLGQPLADYPPVATVMHWLHWLAQPQRPLPRQWISQALRLPFCRGSESEYDGRARFDAWLRRQGHARLSLPALRECLAGWTAAQSQPLPDWAALLDALLAIDPQASATDQVLALLQALGWPGERPLLLSEQRTANALYRQIEALERMRPWLPKGLPAQLRWLRRQLRETLHLPSGSDNAPVQVLGLLDAIGRRFDAVWVANLTAANWPAQPRPNPLIPQVWQQDIPHASSRREREYAERLVQQLAGLAGTVIFSHAARDGEERFEPSPLIAALPPMPAPTLPPAGLLGRLRAQIPIPDDPFQHPWLAWDEDNHALPVAESARARVPGGTGLFKAQAFCPLAGWARRALAVQPLDMPDEELDAAERGSLLHAVLEAFWSGLGDQAALLALDAAAEPAVIAAAVESALQGFEHRHRPLPPRFRQLEAGRLQAAVQAWLPCERARAPFTVMACEQQVEVQWAGFRIRTTIDRIDRLADGSRLVIDYKTGTVSVDGWLGERLFDPQLPLYVQAQAEAGESVGGALFGRVRSSDSGWSGVVAQAGGFGSGVAALQGADRPDRRFGAFADWAALQAFWQQRLQALADEIAAGYAAPLVFDERQLAYCPVRLLLRRPEVEWQRRRWQEQQVHGQ